jgi:hypothetical protein
VSGEPATSSVFTVSWHPPMSARCQHIWFEKTCLRRSWSKLLGASTIVCSVSDFQRLEVFSEKLFIHGESVTKFWTSCIMYVYPTFL